MRRRLVPLVMALMLVGGSCSSDDRDTADGFCRRFNDLRQDLLAGALSEADFQARITIDELGDPGGELSALRADLETAALAQEAEAAAAAGDDLTQLCAG